MVSHPANVALSLLGTPLPEVEADALFVPLFEGEDPAALLDGLPAPLAESLSRAVTSREFQAKPFELFVLPVPPRTWRVARLGLIGCGRRDDAGLERIRRVASAAALASRQRRFARIAVLNRGLDDAADSAQAITEGLVLASYSGDRYKSGERSGPPAEQAFVVHAAGGAALEAIEQAVERGRILGESCNMARGFANEPSNVLTPRVFADRAAAIGRSAGSASRSSTRMQIEKLGMGLLLGVARGSAEPPRVIVMRHDPAGAPDVAGARPGRQGHHLRHRRHLDQAGRRHGADEGRHGRRRRGRLRDARDRAPPGADPRHRDRARRPRTCRAASAIKPGDVLTGAGGKTVEVINTDAEGRLILGDGLWYAQQLGATHLVDVATLTGACVVGLGKAASGLFGRPDAWRDTVRTVADAARAIAAGRCRCIDEYRDQMRSEIADMMNSGGRPAGACTAAMFLKEFTGDLPWAHLDIAGTAWADEAKPFPAEGPDRRRGADAGRAAVHELPVLET